MHFMVIIWLDQQIIKLMKYFAKTTEECCIVNL